jgi:hypothetical protein
VVFDDVFSVAICPSVKDGAGVTVCGILIRQKEGDNRVLQRIPLRIGSRPLNIIACH